ncbi:MAG: phenylacetate--CoA ligase family protein, partial [Planctomycetaceae bacterium]|nr:phenylacetate--CoA ligase family protein [Planctomycetaceae bacterium]
MSLAHTHPSAAEEIDALRTSQWWDAERMERAQFERLRLLLRHCLDFVPWYRETFTAAGVVPDHVTGPDALRRLPMVDRSTFRRYGAVLKALTLPDGIRNTGTLSTSGSTGIPVLIAQTNLTEQKWTAFAVRDLEWCSIDPALRLASVRNAGHSKQELEVLRSGIDLPDWGVSLRGVCRTGRSHLMEMSAAPEQQLDWLVRVDADYLLTFPSNAERLARLAADKGVLLPNLKAVQTIGEMLSAEMRAVIESSLGAPVRDTYSCCEAGYVASPCPDGHGYHVHSENVIVEVLDDDNQPVRPGETGRVVLTTLHNFATPLIRYDIHDYAAVGPERCPCGRGLPLLTEIVGRQRPMFVLPSGEFISSSPLAQGIRKVGAFLQFQVEQTTRRHVVLRIVPGSHWSAEHSDKMLNALHRFFGPSMDCRIECVPEIAAAPGRKLQSTVISPEVTASTVPGERRATTSENERTSASTTDDPEALP